MHIDNTIAEIITTVQKQVNDKYKLDLSFDTVAEIVNVQYVATSFAFARKIPIAWKGFVKFIWTDRTNRNKETKEILNEIDSPSYDLTEKQREYYRYLAIINSSKKLKELKTIGINSKALTKEEIMAIPSRTIHFMDFKILCKKKKK